VVLAELLEAGGGDPRRSPRPRASRRRHSELERLVDEAVAAPAGRLGEVRRRRGQALGALVGAIMKSSKQGRRQSRTALSHPPLAIWMLRRLGIGRPRHPRTGI